MRIEKKGWAMCALILTLLLTVTACSEKLNPEDELIVGRITEEVGSIADFVGWWQLVEHNDVEPYAYIEISAEEGPEVKCYDEEGTVLDQGYIDYSEQRMLNGKSLIVFVFDEIGEHGANPYFVGDSGRYMSIHYADSFEGELEFLDTAPDFATGE